MLGLVGVAPETRYAKCGHLVIAYQDGGGDGVPVVWVPGFVSHVEIQRELPCFYGFIERVERFARLITFDKRGTGLSDRSLGVGTLEDRMDDIRAVYDACGLDRASIVGSRRGVRWRSCSLPPTRSGSTTWCCTAPMRAMSGRRTRSQPPRPRWKRDGGRECLAGLIVQHVEESARGALARFERYACTPSMAAEKSLSDAALDVRGVLGAIDVPTLVLHNRDDPLVPIADPGLLPTGSPTPGSSR